MEKDRYLNQSIIRALRILELFAQREGPLGVTEISRLVGLHKSTVHRLVITLETSGWLLRMPETDKYRIGLKLIAVGKKAVSDANSITAIHPILEKLTQITGETSILTMVMGNQAICVDKVETSQRLMISSQVGQSSPLHAGYRIFILIGMPEEEAFRTLPTICSSCLYRQDPTCMEELRERYKNEREWYVIASGEVDPGTTGIAVPLYFPYERCYGSLGVVCLTIVRTKKRFKEFLLLFSKEPARLENALIGDLKGMQKYVDCVIRNGNIFITTPFHGSIGVDEGRIAI